MPLLPEEVQRHLGWSASRHALAVEHVERLLACLDHENAQVAEDAEQRLRELASLAPCSAPRASRAARCAT